MSLRVAKEKDVIGGYEIPKGATVVIGIDAVHHSPKFWKDPHVFDPDRFDESGKFGFSKSRGFLFLVVISIPNYTPTEAASMTD